MNRVEYGPFGPFPLDEITFELAYKLIGREMPKANSNNTAIWDQVCKTDPKITKQVPKGRMKLTAICAQAQRKRATELFGPYGTGWGITPSSELVSYREVGDVLLADYRAVLFYRHGDAQGEVPICSVIKVAYTDKYNNRQIDDEYMKKLQTDALTKGLSMLGFNSDVFEGKFDDNRYVSAMQQEFAQSKQDPPQEPPKQKAQEPAAQQETPVQETPHQSGRPPLPELTPDFSDGLKTMLVNLHRASEKGIPAMLEAWEGEEKQPFRNELKHNPELNSWMEGLKSYAKTVGKKGAAAA